MAFQKILLCPVDVQDGFSANSSLYEFETLPTKLLIKRLTPGAKMPTRGSEEAACYDLYVSEETILPQHEGMLVPTGIAMGIPPGFCVKVYGRSSLCRKGIQVSTGIIDSDYTGEVKVQAVNFAHVRPVVVHAGERIGQFMLQRLVPTELEETDTLRETARGTKGWGSTGK